MKNLIFDSTIVVTACTSGDGAQEIGRLIKKVQNSDRRIWIYLAQISEILKEIESQENIQWDNGNPVARELLKKFTQGCSWLAVLSEDIGGLDESDPMGASLRMAANRLGEDTVVVTDRSSRLERGHPFIDVETACKETVNERKIQFIDLNSQQDRVRQTLERNIHRVLHHGQYVMGPEVAELESCLAEFVGVNHCICVSSGTDSLLVAMMSLGIGRGHEVVTTPFTFFAAAETIRLLGAKPVYVDIDPKSYNIDPAQLEDAISTRTRAILPVSLFGQCCDMDQINEIALNHGLPVIEDAAQSFGASYKSRRSCGLSTIGCTSFFPAKPLGAYGDAGACLTHDAGLAHAMREIRDHGQGGRYQHVRIGINGRMDSLQAGVLLSKMSIFDDELDQRNKVARRYSDLLGQAALEDELKLPFVESYNMSSWAQYTVEVNRRELIQERMSSGGIPTAVHYPLPVYAQPAILQNNLDHPNTEKAARRVMSLPMHPYLNYSTQQRVAEFLIDAIKS